MLRGAPGVTLTKGWVRDPSAVQLVGAVGAVVPAITHGLQRPALTISTGELRRAAGLCKMRVASTAGHGLGHGLRQRSGFPAGSQPVPTLVTPVSAPLGHWPGNSQVSGCTATWQPRWIGDHRWPSLGGSQIPWVIWGQPSGDGLCLCAGEPFQATSPGLGSIG